MIDITFNFTSDTPKGKDPDKYSPTLRKYHKLLWSKKLPSGNVFELNDNHPNYYLFHKSKLGKFILSSDTVIPSFDGHKKAENIISKISVAKLDRFNNFCYTIGGMMIFPGNRINGKITINGARGFNPLIHDRFDLTVECIRRHYKNINSPLYEVLRRYSNFFKLFGSFKGYTEFFLLQDLVDSNFTKVKFFSTFDNFQSSPVPSSKEEYLAYMASAIEFIQARNKRVKEFAQKKSFYFL